MLCSVPLWISSRFFPNIPISSSLPDIAYPFDYVLFIGGLVCLVLFLFQRQRKWLWGFLGIAFILCIFDQMRWQPWFYLYLLLFVLLSLVHSPKANKKREWIVFTVAGLVFSWMYIWSGTHKLHPDFASYVYPYLLETFGGEIGSSKGIHRILAYGMGVFELGIGIALLWKPTRQAGLWGALAMHILILLILGPFGRMENLIIVPWNLAMIALGFVTFYKNQTISLQSLRLPSTLGVNIVRWGIIGIVVIMPFFSHFGMWDYYLSNTLYAGKTTRLVVVIPKEYESELPPEIQQYLHPVSNTPLFSYINTDVWALGELNVPVYPERRAHYQIMHFYCDYFDEEKNKTLIFRIDGRWDAQKVYAQLECKDLNFSR